jgi:hypothetical protein
METRRLRVGQPITPEQFEELTDEQLERLVPKAYREYFPGKDFCADGHFYLHDGTAWSFYRGGLPRRVVRRRTNTRRWIFTSATSPAA